MGALTVSNSQPTSLTGTLTVSGATTINNGLSVTATTQQISLKTSANSTDYGIVMENEASTGSGGIQLKTNSSNSQILLNAAGQEIML